LRFLCLFAANRLWALMGEMVFGGGAPAGEGFAARRIKIFFGKRREDERTPLTSASLCPCVFVIAFRMQPALRARRIVPLIFGLSQFLAAMSPSFCAVALLRYDLSRMNWMA